jgi:hypothetical protein
MQVGADRRRCGHRGREPRVERQLCGLRQRADEDQRERRRDRAPAECAGLPERDDLGDPVGAGRLAEQDEPQQHHQPAEHGDQQRLDSGAPVLPRLAALAHEQERRHRRQLPEQVEGEQVVGEDEPEHRAGEGEQERGAAGGVRGFLAEVADAVDEDQRADPGDEHDHRQCEARRAGSSGRARAREPRRGTWSRHRSAPRARSPAPTPTPRWAGPPRRRTRPAAARGHEREQAGEDEVRDDQSEHPHPPRPPDRSQPPDSPAGRGRFGLRRTPGPHLPVSHRGRQPPAATLSGRAAATGPSRTRDRCARTLAADVRTLTGSSGTIQRSCRYTCCTTQNNDNRS